MKLTKEEFNYLLMQKKSQGFSHYEAFDLVKDLCERIESPTFQKRRKPQNREEILEQFLIDIESRR